MVAGVVAGIVASCHYRPLSAGAAGTVAKTTVPSEVHDYLVLAL